MIKVVAIKKSNQRMERNPRVSSPIKQSINHQIKTEEEAFASWLQHDLKYDTRNDLLLLGIEAFAITGKLIDGPEISTVFPPSELGMGALRLFIWDVTRNDCRVVCRAAEELGW